MKKIKNSFRKEGDFYVWTQEIGGMKKEDKFKLGVEFEGEDLTGSKYKVSCTLYSVIVCTTLHIVIMYTT